MILCAWTAAAYCGPAFGPLLSAFTVQSKTWRWFLWEVLWISAPVFLLMSIKTECDFLQPSCE